MPNVFLDKTREPGHQWGVRGHQTYRTAVRGRLVREVVIYVAGLHSQKLANSTRCAVRRALKQAGGEPRYRKQRAWRPGHESPSRRRDAAKRLARRRMVRESRRRNRA